MNNARSLPIPPKYHYLSINLTLLHFDLIDFLNIFNLDISRWKVLG
jgi:hypothetical protein